MFRKKNGQNPAGRNVVLEFKPVADHFLNSEVKSDRTDREVERSRHQDIPIPELTRRVDKRLRVREDRRLERPLKQIIRQSNQPVSMHSAIRPEGNNVEQRPRIKIQS